MKVFLGGTWNGSTWRETLIPWLKIDYFNPIVEDWTEACIAEEIRQRRICDFCLYVITPKMTGVYSIAEAVDDSNKREPGTTIFCFTEEIGDPTFTEAQIKSLKQIGRLIESNGGVFLDSLLMVACYLNSQILHG